MLGPFLIPFSNLIINEYVEPRPFHANVGFIPIQSINVPVNQKSSYSVCQVVTPFQSRKYKPVSLDFQPFIPNVVTTKVEHDKEVNKFALFLNKKQKTVSDMVIIDSIKDAYVSMEAVIATNNVHQNFLGMLTKERKEVKVEIAVEHGLLEKPKGMI